MIFFAELKLSTFLISSGATFQSLFLIFDLRTLRGYWESFSAFHISVNFIWAAIWLTDIICSDANIYEYTKALWIRSTKQIHNS